MNPTTYKGYYCFTVKEHDNGFSLGLEPTGDVLPGKEGDCHFIEFRRSVDAQRAQEIAKTLNECVEFVGLIRFEGDDQ
jgi:hypothetical protein